MSDTPRTDRSVEWDTEDNSPFASAREWVYAGFARQLERELAEVTKQRDALVNAIRKHKEILAFTLGDCDEELYKALEEIEEGGASE